MPHALTVKGVDVDKETRCAHYHSKIDRIAIKFYCCGEYYSCFECHKAVGCGAHQIWPKAKFSHKAVLCGSCDYELTVDEYLQCASSCPNCSAAFNPGCSLHKHLYFA